MIDNVLIKAIVGDCTWPHCGLVRCNWFGPDQNCTSPQRILVSGSTPEPIMNPAGFCQGFCCSRASFLIGLYSSKFSAPIEYLGSDRIVMWFIHEEQTNWCSFTSCCPIYNLIDIHVITVANAPLRHDVGGYLAATQWISIWLQIGEHEVTMNLKLNHSHIDHVCIQSELKSWIRERAFTAAYIKTPRFSGRVCNSNQKFASIQI
jgi:hypothetical protein